MFQVARSSFFICLHSLNKFLPFVLSQPGKLEPFERKKLYIKFSFAIDAQVWKNFTNSWKKFKAMTTETTGYQDTSLIWKSINNEVSIWWSSVEAPGVLHHFPFWTWHSDFCFFLESFNFFLCHFSNFVSIWDFRILASAIASHATKFDTRWSNFWIGSVAINHLSFIMHKPCKG